MNSVERPRGVETPDPADLADGASTLDRAAFSIERVVRALAIPFVRPSRISSEPLLVGSPVVAWLFALTYGIVEVRDVLMRRSLQDKPEVLGLNTWARQWLFLGAVGLLWAAFAYWAGGWWFQVRLYLADVNPFDFTRARRIYLAICQVYALPGLAWMVFHVSDHSKPRESGQEPVARLR